MSQSAVTVDGRSEHPEHRHRRGKLLTLLGGRLTRHTFIYVLGTLAVGPFSVISVAVLTRLLAPSEYGDLAVLMVFAGYLTMVYNTGSLHGTFMLVYGISEGEGDEVDSDTTLASSPKRALGTGVLLTLAIVTAGTALCFALAANISNLLLHSPTDASLVRWAAISAATGSLWRLTVNVFRMERKPSRFAVFNALRPLFVVGGIVPLVALGFGIQGALAGTALGTLVASGVCVWMSRHSYALAFSSSDAIEIVRRGSLVVIPVLCLFVVHNSDALLLSRFASSHDVGIYRVASRFAAVPSYFASAFLMAWAPLERGVLFQATYQQAGEQRVRSSLLTYYLLAGTTIVLLLDVASHGLVLLVGSRYRTAAPLIPLIGVGFVCYGLYIVLVRSVKVEQIGQRTRWYSIGSLLAAGLFVGLGTVTIPWLGAYGIPVSMVVATLAASLVWIAAVKLLMKSAFGFDTRPILGLAAAVAIAVAVQAAGLSLWPTGRPFVLAATFASYIAAVIGFGVMPRRHIKPLLGAARAATRARLNSKDPSMGLGLLAPARRDLLVAVERDEVPVVVLAERLNRPEREIYSEYVASLRELIGSEPVSPELDERLARYLLSGQPEAHRDLISRDLVEDGLDPLDLMHLDEAARGLRALSHQAWAVRSLAEPGPAHRVDLDALREHLGSVPLAHRHAAIAILRDGRTPAQVAAETGVHEQLVAARVVRVLRRVGRLGSGGPEDAAIGMGLFGGGSSETRPHQSRAVALTYDRLRGYSRRRWRRRLPETILASAPATVAQGMIPPSAPATVASHLQPRENGIGSHEAALSGAAPIY